MLRCHETPKQHRSALNSNQQLLFTGGCPDRQRDTSGIDDLQRGIRTGGIPHLSSASGGIRKQQSHEEWMRHSPKAAQAEGGQTGIIRFNPREAYFRKSTEG